MDIFSPENTSKSVHDTLDAGLAAVPEGRRSAVLIDATQDQVQLLLAVRAGDSWQIAGGAVYDGRHVKGKVAVMWSGK